MARRKPYNPNTAYGRRKLREEAEQNRPPEKEMSNFKLYLIIILFVILAIAFFAVIIGGQGAKWFTR